MIKKEQREFTITAMLTDNGSVYLNDNNSTPDGWTIICSQTFTFDIPKIDNENQCRMMVDSLEKEKDKIQQEAFNEVRKIDDKIQKLLALPNLSGDEEKTGFDELPF